ncbi:MAG: hypothetical protein L3K03_03225 [Thermoplasmata archaeon]|nr:hypothetical protein [Thermoplasmata archaeon]
MGVFFTLVFGAVTVLLVPTAYAHLQRDELTPTPVSQLQSGMTAKVAGFVSPGQGAVIVEFTYKDATGNPESGYHVENFWLNDSTGRVLIEMGSNDSPPAILSGGEPYPANGTTTGFQYESGDPIVIIGTVTPVPGGLAIQAVIVAQSTSEIVSSNDFEITAPLFGGSAGFGVAVLIAGVILTRQRVQLHLQNLPKFVSLRPKELHAAPTGEAIVWTENHYPRTLRWISFVSLGIAGASTVAFLVVTLAPLPFSSVVFLVIPGVSLVVMLFGYVFGLSYQSQYRSAVARVGVSSTGIHFDYPRPPKNRRTYLAWVDIRSLEAPLAMNRRAAQFETDLGTEYAFNLDDSLPVAIRAAYEQARTRTTGVGPVGAFTPTLDTLRSGTVPLPVGRAVWYRNKLRDRFFRYVAVLVVVQIALIPVAIWLYDKIGLNQGTALPFYPTIFALVQARIAWRAPKEVGVSDAGFTLRGTTGERTTAWENIAEFVPQPRGIRTKSTAGVVETFTLIDADAVRFILAGFEQRRGGNSSVATTAMSPAAGDWISNPLHEYAGVLVLLLLGGPAVVMGFSAYFAAINPLNVLAVLGAILPAIVFVFALFPYAIWKYSPVRVALTGSGIVADYGRRDPGPGVVSTLRFEAIARATPGSQSEPMVDDSLFFPMGKPRSISLATRAGVQFSLGPVGPGIEKAVLARLSMEQRSGYTDRQAPLSTNRPLA